jgi:amino acid adenylation domain-containing protein
MSKLHLLNLAYPVFCQARMNPSRTALVVEERASPYEDLAAAAGRVAGWLGSHAFRHGRAARVGILAARSFETYAGILGTAWAGGTYVPLNPKQPGARLASILQRAGLDALIVDRRGAAHLSDLAAALPPAVLAGQGVTTELPGRQVATWDALAQMSAPTSPPAPVPPDHPAYLIFTSGTTGVPKGVVVTVANVAHFLACIRALYRVGPDDRVGQFCETSFDVSVFEMFAAWDGGASLHVVPETKMMAPGGFIRTQGLTVWSSVPSVILMLTRMNQLQPGAFPSLRVSFFAGEGLPAAAAQAWQAAAPNSVVDNHYGPTEATITCTFQRLTDPPSETPGRGTLSIGSPYPGMYADVAGPDGNFLGPEEVGELALSGPQVAAGYLDDPEQTARQFPVLEHPRLGRSRWYLTGDVAYRDPQGRFHCLGRIDNQVKVLGQRVELEEIEAHLRAVCGSDAVAAVAWPVVEGHAAGVVAFVSGSRLTPAAVRDHLRSRLPHYMVPGKVLMLDSLPLSAHGKVERKLLGNFLKENEAHVRP